MNTSIGHRFFACVLIFLFLATPGKSSDTLGIGSPRRFSVEINEDGSGMLAIRRLKAGDRPATGVKKCSRASLQDGISECEYLFSDPRALDYLTSPFGVPLNVFLNKEAGTLEMKPAAVEGRTLPSAVITFPWRLFAPFRIEYDVVFPEEETRERHFVIELMPHHYETRADNAQQINLVLSMPTGLRGRPLLRLVQFLRDGAGIKSDVLVEKELRLANEEVTVDFTVPLPRAAARKAFAAAIVLAGEATCEMSRIATRGAFLPTVGCRFGMQGDALVAEDVSLGSLAEKAGIRQGDRLVSINDTAVRSLGAALAALAAVDMGDDAICVVGRGSGTERLTIHMREAMPLPSRESIGDIATDLAVNAQAESSKSPERSNGSRSDTAGATPRGAETKAEHSERQASLLAPEAITSLSVKQAELLSQREEALTLNSLTTVAEDAARALAKHGHRLSLNGLTKLSDEAATALAEHEGELYLNGLTTLSAEAAKALAKLKGNLSLNGLTTLSAEAAEALAKHEGGLYLNGLTTLSDEAANALAQHKGGLFLNGLATLSDTQANALAKHKGGLGLKGLTEFSDEAAKALAQHSGEMWLNGLTTLSDEAAKALSLHNSELHLDALAILSQQATRSLAQHNCVIGLSGTIADNVAATREVLAAEERDAKRRLDEEMATEKQAAEKRAAEDRQAREQRAAEQTAAEVAAARDLSLRKFATRMAAEQVARETTPRGPGPWHIESATGLNDYSRVIDNAVAASLGKVSQAFQETSFRGVSLGGKYTPDLDDVVADPWLLPTDVKQQGDGNLEAVVRVLVDAKSGRTIGVFALYGQPIDAMIEPIKKTFGKTFQEIDSREVVGFTFDSMTLKYTFPRTIVRVSGHRFQTRITILDRDYTEAALRPFANAVLRSCRWVKEVADYGNDHQAKPVRDLPLADLRHVRDSSKSLLLLFDESAQKTARTRAQSELPVCMWDIATAWNNDTSQGAVVNLLACDSIGVPNLLLSEDDYVTRTLITSGIALDLFHDVGSAIVQSEFQPSGDTITVRNPKRSWDGDCTAFVDPVLEENDEGILSRAQCLEQAGQPHFLRRAYEWVDKKGWKITFTESLILTVMRGEKQKGL